MMFLPMVQRELRVMSRRPSTYRLRWVAAGIALLTVSLLLLTESSGTIWQGGKILFYASCFCCACVCLLGGVFATLDIISEERRDETLGLLFLTDLKGYDVVVGKFSAIGLNVFYWCMAVMPVLSVPILFGGVTLGEFVRTCIALANLLFFTMCIGTWSSSRSFEAAQSFLWSLLVLLFLCVIVPLFYTFAAHFGLDDRLSVLTFSPVLPFYSGVAQNYNLQTLRFWLPLVSSHLLGWLCLVFASRTTATVWRKTSRQKVQRLKERAADWLKKGFASRRKYLDQNPVLWLMRPERNVVWASGMIAVAGSIAGCITASKLKTSNFIFDVTSGSLFWLAFFLVKLLLVYQACSFVMHTKRTGAFELLLVTPLGIKDYVAAHKSTMKRLFGWQFVLLGIALTALGVRNIYNDYFIGHAALWDGAILWGAQVFMLVVDYHLLSWLALSSALQTRKLGWAIARTVLLGLCVPALFCWLHFIIKPLMAVIISNEVEIHYARLFRKLRDPDYDLSRAPVEMGDYSTRI